MLYICDRFQSSLNICKSLVFLEFFFHMINCLFTFFFIWSEGFLFVCFVFWNSRLFTATIHKKEIERTFSGEREKTKKIFLFQKRKKELKLLGENFHSFFNSQLHVGHMFFNHTVDKLGGLASTLKVWKKQQKCSWRTKENLKRNFFSWNWHTCCMMYNPIKFVCDFLLGSSTLRICFLKQ